MSLPAPYYVDSTGTCTIYHGDARAILPDVDAQVMVADPPYGMAYQSGWAEGSSVAGDEDPGVRDEVLAAWNGPALVFGRWSVPRPAGTRFVLYWDKGDWPGMGNLGLPWGPSTEEVYVIGSGFVGRRAGQVLRCPRRQNGAHPTAKPVELMERLVMATTGTVVDPFMGGGATLVAASNLGRKAIGIEIEERYAEIAAKRLAQEVLPFEEAQRR